MELRPDSYAFDAFRLDLRERALYADGQPVVLTPKAVETLIALVERHGHLVTKDELFQRVWPDAFVEENNLAQNISLLRRVLGEGSTGARFIETVPKRGYRFVAEVTPIADEPSAPSRSPSNDRRRSMRWRAMWALGATALVMVALLTTARTRGGGASEPPRVGGVPLRHIAVQPFTSVGMDDSAYVAAGLTEEIASRLAGLNGLAVRSSTDSRHRRWWRQSCGRYRVRSRRRLRTGGYGASGCFVARCHPRHHAEARSRVRRGDNLDEHLRGATR